MPTSFNLLQRLSDLPELPLTQAVRAYLQQQDDRGQLSPEAVAAFCQQFQLSTIDFALACLPIAACYASPPISQFYVGAIAIGSSGRFYFGANQEFEEVAIAQTIHAEQSAIMHAWLAGERLITDVVVNYTPCGHCRQFMNELNSANRLHIHLPHRQQTPLADFLPDAFGPRDLGIQHALFDPLPENALYTPHPDPLKQAAQQAANLAYAPYSGAKSGVAMQIETAQGTQILTGRYAENAAFNPSFLPLQSAVNFHRMQGGQGTVQRIAFCEHKAGISHLNATQTLAQSLFGLALEVV